MPVFRRARVQDWGQVRELLLAVSLPLEGTREHLAHFLLAVEDDRLVGCGGLEFHGDAALLRSLVVDARDRGRGIVGQLTERLLALAVGRGASSVSLLTTTGESFFPRFGFQVVPKADLPKVLESSQGFRGACPASAVAMIRRFTAGESVR